MGFVRDLIRGDRNALIAAAESGPSFAVDAEAIPPGFYGLASYVNTTGPAPRIHRRAAIQAAPVKRCRDLVPGVLGTLPLDLIGPDVLANHGQLLDQPEANVARSVTMTRLFEDMFFEEIAWWRIVGFGANGFPSRVKRLKPRQVNIDEDRGVVYVDGQQVPNDELIRFDSPTDGLLISAARDIRKWLALNAATERYADGAPPIDYFESTTDVDPFEDDDETAEFLDGWQAARRKRSTGYIPAGLKYGTAGWNPEQLQLNDALKGAALNIANHAGVDPEELGISTTSRTYQNDFDRRKNFTDFTIGQYRQAFEDRMRMGDVTPRDYIVRQNLDAFLRSDTKTRMETYEIGLRVGAYTKPEIRDLEDKPPLTEAEQEAIAPAAPEPASPPHLKAVTADQDVVVTFADDEPIIRLDTPNDAASFEVDFDKRTISGLIVPYGVEGIANGQRWVFSQGTLKFADPKRVKLWIQHDKNRVVGYATKLDDRPDGMYAVFSVEESPEGDEALLKADPEGSATWDAFSIGLRPGGKFRIRNGVNYAIEAPLMETSLTPAPSFDDARVHQVAASAAEERNTMKCTKCGKVHAEGVVECNAADVATFEAQQSQDAPTFDVGPIAEAIKVGFESIGGAGGREVIDPTEGGNAEVTEQPVYRFDGHKAQFSLVEDMAAGSRGDAEARQRIDEFMDEAFAVTVANVATLNPTVNRPELYVPNLQFSRPLWEMVSNGNIDDKTPFTIPKFGSASGLVGVHTEGTEPTPGTFTATNQTVSPTAMSGKIEVDREVLDQGGSPQADQIIWTEMLNAWFEAIEARIAATLNASPTAETNFASAVDTALVNAVQAKLIGLQFVRGGNRFTGLALDGQLFPALVNAADSTGRKLLPVLGATNAQGETSGAFDRVAIGGLTGRAAWALGAATTSKSFLFVPASVYAWASAPKRFTFEYQLKSVDIGIWGYGASAITRDSDVLPLDYTTAD